MEKITHITIWDKNVIATNHSNNVQCKVHEIFLSRRNDWKLFPYYSLYNLSNTKKVKIYRKWFDELPLDESLLEKLTLYLSNENTIELSELNTWIHFDCASFANFIKWIEYKDNTFEPEKYTFLRFRKDILKKGDMIYTWINGKFDVYNTALHFMIYLWEDLYLSKFWTTGRLIVASLAEYEKLYPYKFIYILRKNN